VRQGAVIAGRYRLDEVIGAGGMGEVWRGTDLELDRPVAVKRANLDSVDLLREGRATAALRHPNVVTLYDSVVEDGRRWLILEYVPSRSLAEVLRTDGPLPAATVARVGAQLAAAIAAVHAAGVVHRDVKPGNVLLDHNGDAKLGDFGIARRVSSDDTATDSGLVAGTPAYMAPEVADGDDPSTASDVFALGATLYAAVEGGSPFGRADNPLILLHRASRGEIPRAEHAGALSPVLTALMRRKPVDRPDAATAQRMLAGVATNLPSSDRKATRPLLVAAAAVAVLVVLAVLAIVLPGNDIAGSPTTSAPHAPTTTAEPGPIGDLHTADVCALLDPTRFASMGRPELDPETGNFNLCMLVLRNSEGKTVAELTSRIEVFGDDSTEHAPTREVGRILVQEPPVEDVRCHRTMPLGDDRWVIIEVFDAGNEAPLDTCGIADAAANFAAGLLDKGMLPRRSLPSNSLAWVDTCRLLDAQALRPFPALDPEHPQPGAGKWICEWATDDEKLRVVLKFDRDEVLTADDGMPKTVAGRPSFVVPQSEGDDTCEVAVTYRTFPGTLGGTRAEYLRVIVHGGDPMDTLCTNATTLATAAAGHLPRS
jgi:serine/threonine protein kinase